MEEKNLETATFASGCFWCGETLFKRLKGVESVFAGYAGGTLESPTYDDIHYSNSGHAEAIQIMFDPMVIPYEKLLDVFWHTHNPTTLNRQGADVGTEYRSMIFYHSEEQKKMAENSKNEAQKEFQDPIVTEIVPFATFYKAEAEHQNFYDKNRNAPYCMFVIDPKIQKLLKDYKKLIPS